LENPSAALVHQPSQIAYVVMSSETAVKFQKWPYFISTAPGVAYAYLSDYRRSRRDIYFEDASLAGLARKIGVNPKELEISLPVGTGPYVALGPIRPYVLITDGGLKVTNQLQVTGVDDLPITGLYAAGSSGQGGVLLYGHGHHLGWAFVSGRIAGKNVSKSD
jgi:succinate dehydrogenase/fumarate reductase flavoprotein subunit